MERQEMKKRKSFITNIILAVLCASILIPAASLVVWVFTERWAWPGLFPQVLSDRAVMEIVRRKGELFSLMASSIVISSVVAVLSAAIGVLTSRALILYRFRGQDLMSFLTVLPLMVPATVFAMGIQITFIRMGLNNTVAGVILAHLIYSLPYAVRLIMDGTRAVGIALEEQARVLGAGPFQAFRRTTLPMLVPVILSAVSMSYIVSFSQYFLTLLLGGGRIKTFAVVMVPYLQSGSRNIACVYSILFMGITLLVFAVFERIAGYWTGQMAGGYYES